MNVSDSSRSSLLWLIALFVVFGIGVVLSARWLMGDSVLPTGARVGVLPLRGAIVDEAQFISRLERFRDDGSIRAFVIEIESPGGAVGASQAIFEAIRSLRDEDDRPVFAWMFPQRFPSTFQLRATGRIAWSGLRTFVSGRYSRI